MNPRIQSVDFNEHPFIAIWEVTQACDLACAHCRASAQPDRHPLEEPCCSDIPKGYIQPEREWKKAAGLHVLQGA
jgi:MoaA/NifB/PqqE/SkfB family radical SAM enzyme